MSEIDYKMLNQLRDEMLKVQDRRHAFSLRKLSFTVALFGVGSVSMTNVNFASLLFLVPFVSILFDIYILIEDHRIKRVGEFLRLAESGSSKEEQKWEHWVRSHPNRLAPFAGPLITEIILVGAALVLWSRTTNVLILWIWLLVVTTINTALVLYSIGTRKRFSSGNTQDK